jgi:hypothetical protein
MKFIKGFWIIIGLSAMLFAYIATQVSAVYDPLKSYRYTLTIDELRERLNQTVKLKSNFTFNLTDSTGTDNSNLNYYANLSMKIGDDEYGFNIKYHKETSFWDRDIKSEISLIGAFDIVRKTGGYKTDDPDVEKLINIFESELIKDLDDMNTSNKLSGTVSNH